MGNSAPAPLTVEQEDLKFLGERYPFGDAEFRHLYRAYQQWLLVSSQSQQQQQRNRCACFLFDWGVHCGYAPAQLETVVDELLPPQFGNALFRAAFCAPGDVNTVYHNNNNNTISSSASSNNNDDGPAAAAPAAAPAPVDEYTRRARLEQFFEGLAGSSRRGAKAALTVLFRTTQQQQQQQQCLLQQHAAATAEHQQQQDNEQPSPENDTARTTSINNIPEDRVSAHTFVEIGYRLSLAVAYLQKAKEQEQQQQSPEKEGDSHVDKLAVSDTSSDPPPSSTKQQQRNRHALDDNDAQALAALAQSIVEKGRRRRQRSGMPGCTDSECPHLARGHVELMDVLEWSEHVAPMFASLLPTLFQFVLFPHQPNVGHTRTLFDAPCIIDPGHKNTAKDGVTSTFFHSSTSARLFGLACMSPALTGRYHRLFTSAADGLSFNRLQNAVLGYGGPTLLLVRSTSGGIFGAFTATTWKESKDFFGNTDCFLYQLQPATAVYRPTGNERNYMYCNSAARSRGYDQQAHGIGFGGTVHEPRLFLAETLDDCCAAATDLTFENGRLLPEISIDNKGNGNNTNNTQQQHRKYFTVDSLEVWGVGGTAVTQAALEQREAARAVTNEAIRRARKVDKAQFLDDFRAGTFASKAFQHRQEADGRANDDMDERCRDKDKTYEYA